RYHSVYLDTADHLLYLSHHNGLRSRYKVRFRHYLDSGLQFLEVKKKDNKDRTRKQRLTMQEWQWPLPEAARLFLDAHFPYEQNTLVPGMEIGFSRLTLAHSVRSERLTLDLGLTFTLGERTIVQPNLVVAELKQDRFSTQSPFAQMLRDQRIAPFSMSKYCMGMALLHRDLKQNNFKSRLLSLNKIANERAA
ncbi:MAG: polyphosphate polymerase domain-containing protein, partial [Bacteroidota bacterium]